MTTVGLHLRPGLSIDEAIALARRAEAIGVAAVHGIADEVTCLPLGGPGTPDDDAFFDMLESACHPPIAP